MGWAELEKLVGRIEKRVLVQVEVENEEPECPLPRGHVCRHGWHMRPGEKTSLTAYERCPVRQAPERRRQAAETFGGQTFASFERRHEPEAYRGVREWVVRCRTEASKVALLPLADQANTGCGKTHLLRAAAHELVLHGLSPGWISAGALNRAVRSRIGFSSTTRSELENDLAAWISCPVLIIDGLGFEGTSGATTTAFLVDLLDERAGRSLAISTSWSEDRLLNHYGASLVSRLLGGATRPPLVGVDYRRRETQQGGVGL